MKATLVFLSVLCFSCSSTYYVVRHAEKAAAGPSMSSDVPLSEAGQQRAEALAQRLRPANVAQIFSTSTIRTTGTAAPLSRATGVPVQLYNTGDTAFARRLKAFSRRSILVVGHSNTVDDLVNDLTGRKLLQDLPDTQYGDLFIIKKKGTRYTYSQSRFGN